MARTEWGAIGIGVGEPDHRHVLEVWNSRYRWLRSKGYELARSPGIRLYTERTTYI